MAVIKERKQSWFGCSVVGSGMARDGGMSAILAEPGIYSFV